MVEILLFFFVSAVVYGLLKNLRTFPEKISNEKEKIKNVANYGVGEWLTALGMFSLMVIIYWLLF